MPEFRESVTRVRLGGSLYSVEHLPLSSFLVISTPCVLYLGKDVGFKERLFRLSLLKVREVFPIPDLLTVLRGSYADHHADDKSHCHPQCIHYETTSPSAASLGHLQ